MEGIVSFIFPEGKVVWRAGEGLSFFNFSPYFNAAFPCEIHYIKKEIKSYMKKDVVHVCHEKVNNMISHIFSPWAL